MRDRWRVLRGILFVVVFIILLVGAYSLSLSEGKMQVSPLIHPRTSTPSRTPPPPPTNTRPSTITLPFNPFPSASVTPTPLAAIVSPTLPNTLTPTLSSTSTLTLTPFSTNCPLPVGWLPYTVKLGDTLDGLAFRYKTTASAIMMANCLGFGSLSPGQVIFLPPIPTPSPVKCGAPSTWVIYIVQPGDTLYHLGQVYGISYTLIQRANCLVNSNIHIGQALYVPPWATRTPSPTSYVLNFQTDTPTATPWDVWTDTPSDTPTP